MNNKTDIIISEAASLFASINKFMKDVNASKSAAYAAIRMLDETHKKNSPDLHGEIDRLVISVFDSEPEKGQSDE